MPPRKKRNITAEDLYRFELISDVRISPDGEHVIYSQKRVDQKTEKKYLNLWVVPTRSARPRQFTYGDQSDSSPRWSPDGERIAFLSNRGNKDKPAQIFLIDFQGGEARPLTDIEGEIGGISWSPDGRQLLCTVRKTDAAVIERRENEQKKKLGVVNRHYERVFYKLDGYGYLPKERTHIWVINARTGKGQQITDHVVYDEVNPTWSSDGELIAFVSNRSEDPDFNRAGDGLYIIPAEGGELREINAPIGNKTLPSFSPDGRWIAYYAQEGEGQWFRNRGLWVVPADGSGQPRNLTEAYDLHVDASTINDMGQPETMPPTWSNDGKTLYFPVVLHGSSILKSISIDGNDLQAAVDELNDDGDGSVVGSFSFDMEQSRLAYFYATIYDPGQVNVKYLNTGRVRQLTRVNQRLLRAIDLGSVETHWIEGPDGNDLQGWILKPPGFDPQQNYPAILEIHGGPLTQYGYFFMHEFYYLAAQGYVVHFSNPRGGRGYGEKNAGAIWQDWGGPDYDDLMTWTEYVAKQPYIDAQRMGVTGGSYGGYMTVWIIGHTDRFEAAVTQRCVSNLVSMWGSSDLNWVFQQIFGDVPPFEDLGTFWDHSPIKYIGNAQTPTLVIHSEMDLRCPIEQGEQVFVALKKLDVDSEMVRFPDEFHGLSRTGRTDRRIERLSHIKRWFDKYLK
ncbi:MAG: S9 family peptidase [Chloroflexota bacterium]|nr:S9 family peptidase [Chloroflexota bacterium]